MSLRKSMTVITAPTIRGIVQEVNNQCIQKEDVVSLLKEGEQYVLVCYK